MIDIAIKELLDFSSDTYETLLYQMPEKQRALFVAIASAAKGLLEKDFITNDKGIYQVYDLFFKLWLQRTKL